MEKSINKPILKFALSTVLLSSVFFTLLQLSINSQNHKAALLLAIIFALAMFFNGSFWGKKEIASKSHVMTGFYYHFVTFSVVNFVEYLWIHFFAANNMSWFKTALLGWSIGLISHFISSIYISRTNDLI